MLIATIRARNIVTQEAWFLRGFPQYCRVIEEATNFRGRVISH
jgi:hypothetical protein